MTCGEMLGAAVSEVVAVDRGDDDMLQAQLCDRFGDILRLVRIERAGHAGLHVAEGAGARARVAHDHEGRVLLLPALADIGAAGLLADRDETVFLHDAMRLGPFGRAGRLDADPVRLAQDRLVGPVRLFGMARRGSAASVLFRRNSLDRVSWPSVSMSTAIVSFSRAAAQSWGRAALHLITFSPRGKRS